MRQYFKRVERRRRLEGPFEGGGARSPGIRGGALPGQEGVKDDEDEEQSRSEGDKGADRRHQVPAGKGVGIVADPPRHAGEAEEVHREEGQVDADEERPEMATAE